MVTTLVILLGITILFLLSAIIHITKIQKELIEIDKEQHRQNMDIIGLIKDDQEIKGMLLQHVEILQYLVEQDPKLNVSKTYIMGPMGEA